MEIPLLKLVPPMNRRDSIMPPQCTESVSYCKLESELHKWLGRQPSHTCHTLQYWFRNRMSPETKTSQKAPPSRQNSFNKEVTTKAHEKRLLGSNLEKMQDRTHGHRLACSPPVHATNQLNSNNDSRRPKPSYHPNPPSSMSFLDNVIYKRGNGFGLHPYSTSYA